ncbi:MAG: hypothetical protein IT323_11070 [Anaerolineae bacterium]|nr:hypothetical protein [Anaerolineae bacterium]
MQALARTLAGYDLELLRIIGNRWDVDLSGLDARSAAEKLAAAMLNAEKVADVWSRLPDDQRGALQALLHLKKDVKSLPAAVFSRIHGEIRAFGPDRLVREKPYLNPANVAEALFYRGLIAKSFAESNKGTQPVIFIPTDLAAIMPTRLTGFQLHPDEPEHVEALPEPEPGTVRAADTSLVDDLTTLLAACQVADVELIDGAIRDDIREDLRQHLLGASSPARLALMVALALDMGLATLNENALLKPVAATARTWLDASRPAQVRALVDAWLKSATFNELWYTPGLAPERAGWGNDPALARKTVLRFLEMVPLSDWWPVEDLIEAVKEDEPDFQRPGGDYESWYIRDAQSGNYLRGFESWDQVDGAVLRFVLTGPMHFLGLIDVSSDGAACRLNAYGRALVPDGGEWPKGGSAPEGASLRIQPDGLIEAPRATSRFERFQVARFTMWEKAADPYLYRVTADGIAIAKRQGLRADQIVTFLRRVAEGQLSDDLARQIEAWGKAAASEPVTLSRVVVLRTPGPELMDMILNTPALRRYLGAPLGPSAVVVRDGQWQHLASALNDAGIAADVSVE